MGMTARERVRPGGEARKRMGGGGRRLWVEEKNDFKDVAEEGESSALPRDETVGDRGQDRDRGGMKMLTHEQSLHRRSYRGGLWEGCLLLLVVLLIVLSMERKYSYSSVRRVTGGERGEVERSKQRDCACMWRCIVYVCVGRGAHTCVCRKAVPSTLRT